MPSRDTIRKNIIAKRASLSGGDIQSASLAAATLFYETELYQNAQRIGFYMAHSGEIDPAAILNKALEEGKECYLPTLDPITDNTLIYVNYTKGESLVLNHYQILEPVIKPNNVIGARMLDVVLVPLVSIDAHGNRLGMGKGYYDRTFEFKNRASDEIKPALVGMAYEFQKHPEFEHKNWDVPMNHLITERAVYDF